MKTVPVDAQVLSFEQVERFPVLANIEHGQLFSLSLSNSTTQFTHGLHRFPAKFVPQVPEWALECFGSLEAVTVDPFMGSGTTLVEGAIRGGTHIGLDIDPLARMIARAKTRIIDDERMLSLGEELSGRWSPSRGALRAPMGGVERFAHWFAPVQWASLQGLLDEIDRLNCTDSEHEFLLVVFSSTLRWVSNADDQSQKTYVSGTNPKTPPPVTMIFWRFFDRALTGLRDLNRKRHAQAEVVIPESGDATAIDLEPESVDLAVTSPPYLDSVDYMYNMMLEYFWLGPRLGVPDRSAFNLLRRGHVGAKSPSQGLSLPDVLAGRVKFDHIAPARRAAAASYFALMERHFQSIATALRPGARYVFVVGNSQSVNGAVPVHDALARLAAESGLVLERAFGYRIRRHYMKFPRAGRGGIILVDWVLVFRKSATSVELAELPLPWLTLAPGSVAH